MNQRWGPLLICYDVQEMYFVLEQYILVIVNGVLGCDAMWTLSECGFGRTLVSTYKLTLSAQKTTISIFFVVRISRLKYS